MVDSILSIGLRGMQQGLSLASDSASQVTEAFSGTSEEDPLNGFVALKQAEIQVKSSASIVKLGDDLLGTILDTFA